MAEGGGGVIERQREPDLALVIDAFDSLAVEFVLALEVSHLDVPLALYVWDRQFHPCE